VIIGHIAATRGPSLFQGFHPEFAGLSFSLWWVPTLFYPYYTLFVLSALYHGGNGLVIALRTFGLSVPEALRSGPGFWIPLAGCAVTLFLGILAIGGVLFEIPDPTDNAYARMWNTLVGVDLGR
jgi:succinate dehydrogenase/fumarate reductase cytochrome b subunit